MSLLELKDVSFGYEQEKLILKNTSFTVCTGDFILLLGSNGSGKTTLANLLAGIIHPQRGCYLIEGKKREDFSLGQLGAKIGFVQQNSNKQFFTSSVEKEIAFGLLHRGEEKIEEKVSLALQYFSLEKVKEHHPLTLSQGEKKRLTVACMTVLNPLVLILDEATAGLDWKNKQRLLEYLKRINQERGIAIIFIAHDWEWIVHYADQVFLWQEGRVFSQGKAEDILLEEKLADILPPFFRLAKELGKNFSIPFSTTPLGLAKEIRKLLD